MKRKRRFLITVEDESTLHTLGRWHITPRMMVLGSVCATVIVMVLGYLFVLLTPVKRYIPGYMRKSERAATEEAMLRVDSVSDAYRRNEAWINNLLDVLNDNRKAAAVAVTDVEAEPMAFSPDSLQCASAEEARFVDMMREREKFSLALTADMDAEGMLFYPPVDEGIVTSASREALEAKMAVANGSPVMSLADGSVLAVYGQGTRWSIVMQHDNGFVSRYSSLGSVMVGQSDMVTGGQVIGFPANGSARNRSEVSLELWHNGTPVKPYKYIITQHSMPVSEN